MANLKSLFKNMNYNPNKFILIILSCFLFFSCHKNTPEVSLAAQHKTKVWILENNPQIEHPLIVQLFDELFLRLREGYLNLGMEIPKNIKIILIENNKIGAFSLCDGTIFISTGTMRELNSAHQLISLLAHEISHVKLRHACTHSENQNEILDYEKESDKEAVKILSSAYIDPSELKNVFINIYSSSEKLESNNTDQINSQRIRNLDYLISKSANIDTKIPQERLFRKVQSLLASVK
jgi:hypothetical protein